MFSSILNSSGALTTLFGQTTTTKSILATSNTAIFSMSSLVSKVRNLSNQASQLQESDKAGIAALHKQVAAALDTFNNISSAVQSSGTLTSASGATITAASTSTATTSTATTSSSSTSTTATAEKEPTLADLKSTLATMQTTLRSNITKVGGSISSAILASGQASSSSYSSSAYSASSASTSMSALWAKLYSSGSRYL